MTAGAAENAGVNTLESNTGSGQQGEMSKTVEATAGRVNLEAGDLAGVDAAADEATLAAARAEQTGSR